MHHATKSITNELIDAAMSTYKAALRDHQHTEFYMMQVQAYATLAIAMEAVEVKQYLSELSDNLSVLAIEIKRIADAADRGSVS